MILEHLKSIKTNSKTNRASIPCPMGSKPVCSYLNACMTQWCQDEHLTPWQSGCSGF